MTEPKRPGPKPSNNAATPAQRKAKSIAALEASGGRVLRDVALPADCVQGLAILRKDQPTDAEAVRYAIRVAAGMLLPAT